MEPPPHEQVIADNAGTLPQDTSPLDLLRGLELDPSWQPENPELKGLTEAVKALADDVSKQLRAIGDQLGTLESDTKPTVNHVVSTSTPAPEVRNGTNNAP